MKDLDLERTRRSLHAVAELVLAGPQYGMSRTIKLSATPGGFGTVAVPSLRVVGDAIAAAGSMYRISGETPRSLAILVGVEARSLDDVYPDGCAAAVDDELEVDAVAARRICDAFATADTALRLLAASAEPILWPEHFDIGIRLDEVNYGVSPGDDHQASPYAYVGVDPVPSDAYWNAPFGRTRAMTEFADAQQLHDFFADARDTWHS